MEVGNTFVLACLRAGMLFCMAASPAHISSHVAWSRPHTSESVSRRDPPILSILILHSLMDLLLHPSSFFQCYLTVCTTVCTDASLLSNCSAYVTEMLLCCSAFASLDQKSPVASSHFHNFIASIGSAKESHNHSSKMRFNPASRIFLTTSSGSCCMHLSACNNNSCVSTVMGSVLSLPACVFGKIKRARVE